MTDTHFPTTFSTGETASQLRQRYNPDGSPLREAQLRMLDMVGYLCEAARACGVALRLDGGNVLGAVRHGGFIPWDDDVDVVVSRRDFKTLCRYLREHPHPQYHLQTPQSDPGSLTPWGRLRDTRSEYKNPYDPDSRMGRAFAAQQYHGLQVDIFPYENRMLPRLQRLAGKMACTVAFDMGPRWPRLARLTYRLLHGVVFPAFRLLGRCIGDADLCMHSYGSWFYFQFPREVLLPHRELVFEGRRMMGPADTDRFLRIIYGDYMQLPPVDKRAVHGSEIVVYPSLEK